MLDWLWIWQEPSRCAITILQHIIYSEWSTEGGGFGRFKPPPPPEIPKALQNRDKHNPIVKTVKNCWIWDANTASFSEKDSKILKLPPVRICFTLAMTNKLAVIINNLKVQKINNILLYEMKFLVPKYSCIQNPWLGGHRPQIPVLSLLCPQLNLLTPTPKIILGYATALRV